MTPSPYAIFQCQRPNCHFRFPAALGNAGGLLCPKCGGPTLSIALPDGGLKVDPDFRSLSGQPVEALLDNIRSTFNVGAMFRTADGAGLSHLHLCGITPTPDHPKIIKTALGAEFAVPWTQHWNAVDAAAGLKASGKRLWALEGGPASRSIFDSLAEVPGAPLVLVVGNEVTGVDPELLELCERVIAIPMQGFKQSLNVSVAFGVAVYTLRNASAWHASPDRLPREPE